MTYNDFEALNYSAHLMEFPWTYNRFIQMSRTLPDEITSFIKYQCAVTPLRRVDSLNTGSLHVVRFNLHLSGVKMSIITGNL